MQFPRPLIKATLLRRYKRFLADVRLPDGREGVAHCPNPGSMMGLAWEGATIWLDDHGDPKRKLAFGWDLVEAENGALVDINTGRTNRIVEEALTAGKIPALTHYPHLKREVKYGENSRCDFLLTDDQGNQCWVEVKSVSLSRQPGLAEFPDAKTARGLKHLGDLADQVAAGDRAVLLFCAVRGDCDRFQAAADIDPAYALGLKQAQDQGVEVMVWDCEVSPDQISLRRPLEFER